MKKFFTFVALLAAMMPAMGEELSQYDANKPVGWAAVGKTTGGEDQNPMTVTTFNELKTALNSKESKRTIYIKGEITMDQRLYVKNGNLTIYGLPGSKLVNPRNSKAEYNKSGVLYFQDAKNVIFRNVVFSGGGAFDWNAYDCLCLESCDNIWLDHCEFYDGMDGNVDIVEGTDHVTFTWCKFGYKIPAIPGGKETDDHRFTNLIGNNDGMTSDNGHLRVTFSNCWWSEGCVERMPRVRFGQVHVANCLYSSTVTSYCFGVGYMSKIYAEGNAFISEAAKTHIWKFPNEKSQEAYHFKLVNSLGAADIDMAKGTEQHFDPRAAYSDVLVYAPTLVEATVTKYAGAVLTEEQLTTRGNSATAIGSVKKAADVTGEAYFTTDGRRLAVPQRGLNIIRKSDGTTKVVYFPNSF
ncbi:MAG: chromophore lyase [Prevotella sp.]|nr:chromophore lyase [Prevotella sp.]